MYTRTGQENEMARFSDHWYKKHPKTFMKDSSKNLPMQTVYIICRASIKSTREQKTSTWLLTLELKDLTAVKKGWVGDFSISGSLWEWLCQSHACFWAGHHLVWLSICQSVFVFQCCDKDHWTFFSQPSWNDRASCQPVSCGVTGVPCFYLLYSNYVIIIIMICFSWDILDTPCTHTHTHAHTNKLSHTESFMKHVKWVQFSGLHQFHAERLGQ